MSKEEWKKYDSTKPSTFPDYRTTWCWVVKKEVKKVLRMMWDEYTWIDVVAWKLSPTPELPDWIEES